MCYLLLNSRAEQLKLAGITFRTIFMIDESKLEELVKLGLSTRQIAAEVRKGQTTVRYWLKKYNMYVNPSKGGRKRVVSIRACLNCNNLLKSKTSKSKYCNSNCVA